VDLIDKPTEEELDRSHGDVHSMGNPHLHLNPYNMIKVARAILNILKRIDPENKDFYLQNYDDFVKIFTSQIKNLEDKAKNLQNNNFISHHKDFDYLAQWLNFKIPHYLEEKPGITPSASYLNKLLKNIATTKIDGIIRSPYSPPQASLWFASKTNIKEFVVPYTKDFDSKNNLIQLYTDIIDTLINNVG
jgi:zinc/manganese transport system substrate-binding protein